MVKLFSIEILPRSQIPRNGSTPNHLYLAKQLPRLQNELSQHKPTQRAPLRRKAQAMAANLVDEVSRNRTINIKRASYTLGETPQNFVILRFNFRLQNRYSRLRALHFEGPGRAQSVLHMRSGRRAADPRRLPQL
jgi:hypothetical protein